VKRKSVWAKSGSTPDWLDVEAALRAIADLYSVTSMVTILPEGTGATGGMKIAISSTWETIDPCPGDATVITARLSQCYSGDALPAFVLGGIIQHEYELEIAMKHQNNAR